MPIPFILGAGAVVAGAVGVGNGISGAAKMKEASDTLNLAEKERSKDSFTNRGNLVIIRKEQKISSERKEIYAKRTYDQICRSRLHCG